MGLTLKKPITLKSNIEIVDDSYIRLVVLEKLKGTSLRAALCLYDSKQAFTDSKGQVFSVSIPNNLDFDYDRSVQGSDTLAIAQTTVKASLLASLDWLDADIIEDILP